MRPTVPSTPSITTSTGSKRLAPVLAPVIDSEVRTEGSREFELSLGAGGGEHDRGGAVCELDKQIADAAAGGEYQHPLAGRESHRADGE